jgi:type IV secretory pathway TrbD component
MMIAKRKLLLLIGIAITGVSLGVGVWAATMTAPTTVKIIECLSKKDPNQTFTGPNLKGQLEECASQYPYNPTAGLVFGISNLLFWTGIIIVVVAVILIIRDWYVRRKTGSVKSKSSRYDK